MQVMDKLVECAGTLGLRVIFDHHTNDGGGGQQPNGLWFDKGPGTDGTDGAGHVGYDYRGPVQDEYARVGFPIPAKSYGDWIRSR